MVTKPAEYEDATERLTQQPIELSSHLTHDECIRGSALSIACRYYVETIVKDGELYREMVRDNKVLKPATYVGVIEVAMAFEAYLRGDLKKTVDEVVQDNPNEKEGE